MRTNANKKVPLQTSRRENEQLESSETETKTTLQRFCMEEAKFRADEAGYELSEKEMELLAEKFYERSESWIDSEKLEEITENFVEKILQRHSSKSLEELEQYRKIGTVEQCEEAMEKQIAKEAALICEVIPGEKYECPYCGTALTEEDMFAGHCKWCGQAITAPEK